MEKSMKQRKMVNIRSLKDFVTEELPSSSMLRRIVLQEKDSISARSFIVKMGMWIKVMREERQRE